MLKIKNGKLYGSNYSFALPEGFYLNVSSAVKFGSKRLELASIDGLIIMIYFHNRGCCAKKETQEIIDANSNLIKMDDFIPIKRGACEGIGLYYRDEVAKVEHYEEMYDFKKNRYGETQIDIDISLSISKYGNIQSIREAIELPTIKAFLESIEYF